ncbi:hypothetical protein S245_053410 [Arachis hypogaea]
MTISLSKVVVSMSMLLAIIFSLNFNVGVGGEDDLIPPPIVVVSIYNRLNNKELGVHCKDKHTDFGFQRVSVGHMWGFTFRPNPLWFTSLYFCSFTWYGAPVHRFDIYDHNRDKHACETCVWDIFETGPCRVTDNASLQCYAWKQ